MSAWDEIRSENDADAREQLAEPCMVCGVTLNDHYDVLGRWRDCRTAMKEPIATEATDAEA